MTRLILGSASEGRQRVLRQAGVEPTVVVSGVDEDAIIAALGADAAPADVVRCLAEAKAEQVVTLLDAGIAADCVVVACDSMLFIDGRLVDKPATIDAARREWQSMSGRCGQLHTGHCLVRLVDHKVTQRAAESCFTTVYFGTPATAELDAYLDSGEPLGVAGAFTLDGLGGWFVDRIDGDPSNVIGLSLPLLRRMLNRIGLSVAELW